MGDCGIRGGRVFIEWVWEGTRNFGRDWGGRRCWVDPWEGGVVASDWDLRGGMRSEGGARIGDVAERVGKRGISEN